MAIHNGNLLVFDEIVLLKNIFAENKPVDVIDGSSDTCKYTWVDSSIYEWIDLPGLEFCELVIVPKLNQVFSDGSYTYAVTTSGLDVFDTYTANKVSYIYNEGGFTTIWCNDLNIYLGTSNDGIMYIEKSEIFNSEPESVLLAYDYFYKSSSNTIKYLYGFDTTLAAVTDVGIDIINNNTQGFKSITTGDGFTKCFMTSKKELYYIVQSDSLNGVCKINNTFCDWEIPDLFYASGLSFLPADQKINDIFITEKTSLNGIDNTLFVATSAGLYILDEGTTEFDVYYSEAV